VLSNFALRIQRKDRVRQTIIMQSPFWWKEQ
jgi:hypothetical protein